jgi:hypothetical protein
VDDRCFCELKFVRKVAVLDLGFNQSVNRFADFILELTSAQETDFEVSREVDGESGSVVTLGAGATTE